MHVWMLGWTASPLISGGVGLVTSALAHAMMRQHVHVTLVVPQNATRSISRNSEEKIASQDLASKAFSHVLSGFEQARPLSADQGKATPKGYVSSKPTHRQPVIDDAARVTLKTLPTWLENPYLGNSSANYLAHLASEHEAAMRAQRAKSNPPEAQISDTTTRPARTMSEIRQAAYQTATEQHTSKLATAKPPIPVYARTDMLYQQAMAYVQQCVAEARTTGHIDLIHAHDWMSWPAAMAVASDRSCPWVAHVHSTEYDRAGNPSEVNRQVVEFERRGLADATHIITVSKRTRDQLIEHYRVDKNKISVIHPAWVNPEMIQLLPTQHADHMEVNASLESVVETFVGDAPMVLFAGRLAAQKGIDTLLDAVKDVHRYMPEVRFVIAGASADAQEAKVLTEIQRISERVLYTGYVPYRSMQNLYRIADVFVMPSRAEPFGLAALEAAAAGVPIIVSSGAGVCELISATLQIPPNDPEALADRILNLLHHRELSQSMARTASYQAHHYLWQHVAKQTRAVYHELLMD